MSLNDIRDKVEIALESLIVRWTLAIAFGILVTLAGWTLKTVYDTSMSVNTLAAMQTATSAQFIALATEFDRGRTERLTNDIALGKRIDDLSVSISQRIDAVQAAAVEAQRQISLIEGKMGMPDMAPGRH